MFNTSMMSLYNILEIIPNCCHNEQLSFWAFQRYLQALQAILQVLLCHKGPEEPNKGMASAANCYSHGEDGVSACGRQYRAEAYGSGAKGMFL
jgi:hypothetical protein